MKAVTWLSHLTACWTTLMKLDVSSWLGGTPLHQMHSSAAVFLSFCLLAVCWGLFLFCLFSSSPWYNRTGWLGVKHQVTFFFCSFASWFSYFRHGSLPQAVTWIWLFALSPTSCCTDTYLSHPHRHFHSPLLPAVLTPSSETIHFPAKTGFCLFLFVLFYRQSLKTHLKNG